MMKQSRREFLVQSAAGMLAAGTAGVGFAEAQQASKPPAMSIARWTGAKPVSAEQFQKIAVSLTEKAIEAIGGLKRFVSKGDVVWVKPNIGWDRTPELAANTNPDVVATLIRLCFEAGAKKVKVGDNPCDKPPSTYAASGIADAAKALGAEVHFLDKTRFKETDIGGQRVKSIPVWPDILDCDLVINVPVVKHHRLAIGTLCMKNYMGVIEKRNVFHQAIPECLVDITRFMKPRICVLDAMRVLMNHGPKGGDPADVRVKATIAAGVDIVALDALGAELLERKPTDIPSIVLGQQAGLGTMDYRALAPREISLS